MSRPRKYAVQEWDYDLSPEQKAANRAEWSAYWASPEGIAEHAAIEAAKAEAERAEAERYAGLVPIYIAHVLREAGVPDRALDIEAHETVAMAAVKDAVDMLVLSGAPGVGKTVAASRWLRAYVSEPSRWAPSNWDMLRGKRDSMYPNLSGRLVPTYQERTRPIWISASQLARTDHYEQAGIDVIAQTPRLVIDDLGAEYNDPKGFFISLLDELIDLRYAGKRPTIITTNLDAAGFAARYGARIVDRIREAGRFVGCGDVSLRRRPTTTAPTAPTRDPSIGHYPASAEYPTKTGRMQMP
jgi:DNA replication protein DnaC